MHTRALDGTRSSRFQPSQDIELLACAEQHDLDVRLVEEALRYAITRSVGITPAEFSAMSPELSSKLCAAREKWTIDNALHRNSPDLGSETAAPSQGQACSKCMAKYHSSPNPQKIITSIWGKKYVELYIQVAPYR